MKTSRLLHPNFHVIDLYVWAHDDRGWVERLELAAVLGSFLPGDKLAADRLFDRSRALTSSDERVAIDLFWSAVLANDVPKALELALRAFPCGHVTTPS